MEAVRDFSDRHNLTNALVTIGASVVAYKVLVGCVLPVLSSVYRWFLRPGMNLRKYGEWAVITGATDGIGKAYAFELARKKLNVVLISRDEGKLQTTASEIEAKHNVKTKIIAVDFSKDRSVFEVIEKALVGLEVGILVNNVGVGYEYPEYFADVPIERVYQLIDLNVTAATVLTHQVLKAMVERKRGAIINIGSGSGLRPTGLLGEYSATKAYMDFFSQSLQQEYASKGIFVQSVMPLFVATKLSKIRKASFGTPNPNTYARSAVATIGHDTRTLGYWSHALQITIGSLLPGSWFDSFVLNLHHGLRKRALKKKEKTT